MCLLCRMFEMDVLLGRTFKGKGTANVHKPDPSLLIYSSSSLNSAGFRVSLSLSLNCSFFHHSYLSVLWTRINRHSTYCSIHHFFFFSFKIKLTGARSFNQLAKSASANTGSTILTKSRFIGALSEYLMGACRIRHGLALML